MYSFREYIDLPYAQTPSRDLYHEFDLFAPSVQGETALLPLICFVHGGAWRSEDKSYHRSLARKLVNSTGYPVALPNYRLTPKSPTADDYLHHPTHAEDILQFLKYILSWGGPESRALYDPSMIYLLGHSCGAHMVTSILLDSSHVTPSLTPPPNVLKAVQGVVLSEGIYDLQELLKSFPGYRDWFIENAFGKRDDFSLFSTTSLDAREHAMHIEWLVIHSKGDTLVDEVQSRLMYTHLRSLYRRRDRLADNYIKMSFDDLDEEHNDLLRGDKFVQIVTDFIRGQQSTN
ncbi:alpha/beta-hydrolase [Gloeophyllum trabeum ATCC 11539]|uniref:Alpha/beta-hydrolase n=1 Tax=Gloeophyllum trabeum (strain ATCC 11539 / FP-39264 / Madison 617) TaxID=670483 RepID=S7QEG2_GLOTA|nr:alpha/beta-hydrolase [Gloeophyllum trabeum ATCC 11539]EPQ58201.1 alpha/beta-hydrolase [Gloeophyllum trabeum ATCC 11539]